MQCFDIDGWTRRFRLRFIAETPVAPSRSWSFHCLIWLACTSNCWDNSNQRLLAPDGGKRHLCLESRAVVPARSSRHGLSCSRHLSRSQAEIPLILAVQISPSQLWLSIASLCFVTVRRAMLMPVSFSQATISSSESTSEASAAILALMRWRMRERFPGGDHKSAEAR